MIEKCRLGINLDSATLEMLKEGARDLLLEACSVEKEAKIKRNPITDNCHIIFAVCLLFIFRV